MRNSYKGLPMPQTTIISLLMQHFPLGLLLSIKDALIAGAARAHIAARPMLEGLVASYIGQQRYHHMNDAFHRALEENGARPTSLCGSSIITGCVGIFTFTRLNCSAKADASARSKRSKTRCLLADANDVIGRLEQPDIFAPSVAPSQATVFFISVFNNKSFLIIYYFRFFFLKFVNRKSRKYI